jgi:hypothetical protein
LFLSISMTAGQLKGTLLEYIVRSLMINCGFTSVIPDGHYIYQQDGSGLFFINGKGAAHDADVLMEPPIQMPFSYPSRLMFECKSYDRKIGLDVIRNGLGLRYDVNEFEIVTDETIQRRKNNRRDTYAISNRKRYHYQVGIASVEEFSRPAFEFAANNKIPLLSMRWFLNNSTCDLFHRINDTYLHAMSVETRGLLYRFLKDKNPDSKTSSLYDGLFEYLLNDDISGQILRDFEEVINNCVVGLLETGDLLFLFATEAGVGNLFREQGQAGNMEARLHYYADDVTKWTLAINNYRNQISRPIELEFNVPKGLLSQWSDFNYDKYAGYTMKGAFFSRIFIFSQRASSYGLPFTVVNLDSEWLEELRTRAEQ